MAKSADIKVELLNMPAVKAMQAQNETMRAVIGRLLAGYRPYVDDSLNHCWIGMHPDNEVDADMSDAEAAVITEIGGAP